MVSKLCIDCAHFKVNKCEKDLKNAYGNCKKYKAISIEQLTSERNKLKVSGKNPERLKYLNKKIDYFNWGIQ